MHCRGSLDNLSKISAKISPSQSPTSPVAKKQRFVIILLISTS